MTATDVSRAPKTPRPLIAGHPGKYLRREVIADAKRLAMTANLLRGVDDSFRAEIDRFGGTAVLDRLVGPPSETLRAALQRRASLTPERPPLKLMRRRLRRDLCWLNERVQLLQSIDPTFATVLDELGASPVLDKIEEFHRRVTT